MISSWVLVIAKWPLRLGIQGTYKSRATTPFVNDITWLLMMWITLCGIMFILVNEHVICDVGFIGLIVEQACWDYYEYGFHCQSCCSIFMHVWLFHMQGVDYLFVCYCTGCLAYFEPIIRTSLYYLFYHMWRVSSRKPPHM